MLNKIFIMGRLTRDPELRRTQSGTAVTSFSLAVDRDFKSQSGEKETDFIDVVAWRSTAEFVAKYFTKGRMAVVEAGSRSVTGKTAKATTAEVRKWLPTTSISATQAGRRSRRRQLLRSSGLWRTHRRLYRPCGRQLRICRDRRGGRRPAVLITPQVTPNSIKEEFFHGYGTRK